VNLLASAIPGLRDVRAPLVAGYLWLLFAWLVVLPETPLSKHAGTGAVASVVGLATAAGPVATAAGVSVAAYLIGAISTALPGGGLEAWRSLRAWKLQSRGSDWQIEASPPAERSARGAVADAWQPMRDETRSRLTQLPVRTPDLDLVAEKLWHQGASLSGDEQNAILERVRALPAEVSRDLRLPQTLLVGDKPEVFAEADRSRAEAEFRLAVVAPLTALTVILVQRGGPWWLFAAGAPLALLFAGLAKDREARSFIRDAIAYGKAPSPALDRFTHFVDEQFARATGSEPADPGSLLEDIAVALDEAKRTLAVAQGARGAESQQTIEAALGLARQLREMRVRLSSRLGPRDPVVRAVDEAIGAFAEGIETARRDDDLDALNKASRRFRESVRSFEGSVDERAGRRAR
jgi:hypothetical protein